MWYDWQYRFIMSLVFNLCSWVSVICVNFKHAFRTCLYPPTKSINYTQIIKEFYDKIDILLFKRCEIYFLGQINFIKYCKMVIFHFLKIKLKEAREHHCNTISWYIFSYFKNTLWTFYISSWLSSYWPSYL